MPIHIKCHDKLRDRAQPTEYKWFSTLLAIAPMACYADQSNC